MADRASEAASIAPVSLKPGSLARLTRQQRYTLFILLLIYVLNFVDRQIVNILAEPIKRDLQISDTQLGLLTGFAFAVFYAVLGLPIARYADRSTTDRVRLISVALAAWSIATALCGLARTFPQLVLARIGVGVGEAGCSPAAISLIADTVPATRRASAFALYGLGVPIGSLIGLIAGGTLNDAFGWRMAFVVAGVPGVIVAAIAWATLREPRRTRPAVPIVRAEKTPSMWNALSELAGSRVIVQLVVGASIIAFLGYGKAVWTAVYFMRRFDLSTSQVGIWLGLGAGIAGVAGTWAGGALAELLGRRDPRLVLAAPIVGMLAAVPIYLIAYALDDWRIAISLLAIPTALSGMYFGPLFAVLQGLVEARSRATIVAAVSFCQNLIGLGLGPLIFGILSDALRSRYGTDSVQMVLLWTSVLPLIPAWLFWRASRQLSAQPANDDVTS